MFLLCQIVRHILNILHIIILKKWIFHFYHAYYVGFEVHSQSIFLRFLSEITKVICYRIVLSSTAPHFIKNIFIKKFHFIVKYKRLLN